MRNPMYRFETRDFVIRAEMREDNDLDLSWDEDGETAAKLDSGEYVAFGTVVTVTHKPTGLVVGEDSLWGSIYADAGEFFTAHRTSPAECRGTYYFPDMVREACRAARDAVARMGATHLRSHPA